MYVALFVAIYRIVSVPMLSLLLLLTWLTVPASATLLNFDNLSPRLASGSQLPVDEYSEYSPIVDGYAGLKWSNFACLDGQNVAFESGFTHGVVSPRNVAFNQYGLTASISGQLFNFKSVYLCAAWNDDLFIEFDGYRGSSLVYQRSVMVGTAAAQLFSFDYTNIDRLQFTSAGGAPHGYAGEGEHFVMDNLDITSVPEPTSVGVLALAGFGFLLRRR